MFVIAAVTMSMIAILSAFNGIEDLVQDLFGTLDADLAAVPISGEVLPYELGEIIGEYPGVAEAGWHVTRRADVARTRAAHRSAL